ncbi:hypothetical protein DL766_001540 [Monosporascus sp. MC13-8B]|uniref:Uncharacterized protein n=1 Tax=Monosporascus cannonballus TaxID=155416 RepID=A0ABY0HHV1_9PEZI|nr:hypothetical protein DL763_005230 [Monosporascus cannonballus]RYO93777.1 hypothetical protein DL762_000982 [Monosporascus cannonballus]RYP37389.1 hypothetical protein DL766_001540 [Monosporascus sp. MC13-8B]
MPFMGHTKPADLSSAASPHFCLVAHVNKSQQPKGDSGVALPDHKPGVFCEPNIASHNDSQFGDKIVERIQWTCVSSAQGCRDDVLERRGTNDSSDCAVASESSSGSLVQLNGSKATINGGRLRARVSQNGRPKKAFCSPSLLFQIFKHEKIIDSPLTETMVRPPPGFECFGVRKVANGLQQQAKPASTTDGYTPAPELEYLRLIGQLGYKEPFPDDLESLLCEVLAAQEARATKSPDVMGTRRSARKKLKMESKIDSVAVPYETTTYAELDD